MAFEIESGILLPPKSGGGASVYPWKQMQPGDSFQAKLADSKTPDLRHLASSLTSSGRAAFGKGNVAIRALPEGDGFRVWRLA